MKQIKNYIQCRRCGWLGEDDMETFKCPNCNASHLREFITTDFSIEDSDDMVKLFGPVQEEPNG